MSTSDAAAVLDASIAVKWHLGDENDVGAAKAIRDLFTRRMLSLVAPEQIRYEVASAITLASQRRPPRLSPIEASLAINEFLSLRVPTVSDDALIRSAHLVSIQYGCAFYDGLYVALAERLAIPLITADHKLYQLVGHLPLVVWLTDFPIPTEPGPA